MCVFSAIPGSILRVSIQKLFIIFKPHVPTNGEHAFLFLFFSRQVLDDFVYFRVVESVIPLEQM